MFIKFLRLSHFTLACGNLEHWRLEYTFNFRRSPWTPRARVIHCRISTILPSIVLSRINVYRLELVMSVSSDSSNSRGHSRFSNLHSLHFKIDEVN